MIEYIKKDITTVDCGIIAHGVNCHGVMGSGVALAIRNRWPVVFEMYKETCYANAMWKTKLLGHCEIVSIPTNPLFDQLFVANLYTQLNYGKDGKVYASTYAIDKSMQDVMSFCEHEQLPLYISRIGCGLGGLNWEVDVLPIVARHAAFTGVSVYVCDL